MCRTGNGIRESSLAVNNAQQSHLNTSCQMLVNHASRDASDGASMLMQ